MARRRYLVAYDIRDPARLRSVHKNVKGYGYALQYSVWICDLDRQELIALKWTIGDTINQDEDAVAIIDLGPAEDTRRFEFLGVHPNLPRQGATIL